MGRVASYTSKYLTFVSNNVLQLSLTQLSAPPAMAAILRDRINDLLTANADLEREVARLRYADAGEYCSTGFCNCLFVLTQHSARGAAESVETLDKLRKTRDTLNDIVTENDQLKIEVSNRMVVFSCCYSKFVNMSIPCVLTPV